MLLEYVAIMNQLKTYLRPVELISPDRGFDFATGGTFRAEFYRRCDRPTYCICSVHSRAELINVSKRTRVNENYIRVTNIYDCRIRGAYL